MAQYYALVAGLPNISLDLGRAPMTQEEFYSDLLDTLSKRDKEWFDWLRLEHYNKEFLRLYQAGAFEVGIDEDLMETPLDASWDSVLPVPELRAYVQGVLRGQKLRCPGEIPYYIGRFLYETYRPESEEDSEELRQEPSPLSAEDRLTQLYYGSIGATKSQFLSAWFGFNQTLRNVLALYTCRHLGWEAERYLVGEREIEHQLLTSQAKDFDLSETVPHIQVMINIAGERDITRRERMIDALRWQWLEEQTVWTVFDIENVLAYYLKLGIIERWQGLDEEQGRAVFREIVMGLKQGSREALEDFRQRTKR